MKTHKFLVAQLAVALTACSSQAALYNVTFTGGGYTANGQITITASPLSTSGYTATSGFLDVTHDGATVDYNYLAVSAGGTQQWTDNNGDNLPYGGSGNYVLPNYTPADPFLDANGLLFTTSDVNGHGEGMYLSIDQNSPAPVAYNLNGYGNVGQTGFGYNDPNVDGVITLVAVPEPVPMAASAGLAAVGLLLFASRKTLQPSI